MCLAFTFANIPSLKGDPGALSSHYGVGFEEGLDHKGYCMSSYLALLQETVSIARTRCLFVT